MWTVIFIFKNKYLINIKIYKNTFAREENLRYIFRTILSSNELVNTWANARPFWDGVVLLSIIVGISAFSDIPSIKTIGYLLTWINTFTFMIIIRILSDFICLIGTIYAIISICRSHFKYSVIAYYLVVATFVIKLFFLLLYLSSF